MEDNLTNNIEYNSEREISGLTVRNDRGVVVYELKALDDKAKPDSVSQPQTGRSKGIKAAQPAQSGELQENAPTQRTGRQRKSTSMPQEQADSQKKSITRLQMDGLQAELDRTGGSMEDVKDRYKIQNPEKMTEELYRKVMSALSRTKSAGAA